MKSVIQGRPLRLFLFLGGFFITNALVAEFIGVKIFALEESLGIAPFEFNLFGEKSGLMFSAGVILWPIVFIMTDIINEYFGVKGVRLLSIMTIVLIAYSFIMIFWSIGLSPAEWWVSIGTEKGVPDMQKAYHQVFGQTNWIIVASLIAFGVGQMVDALIFRRIRRWIGDKRIWLRATISTLVSQFIDSFVVLYIAFVIGPQQWPINRFLAVGTVNYSYKVLMAFLLIPLLYVARYFIEKYLGEKDARKLKKMAVHG